MAKKRPYKYKPFKKKVVITKEWVEAHNDACKNPIKKEIK
jgi:hypothetical protein